MHYDWTEKRLATLRRMHKDNATGAAIARALGGISAKAVRRKIKALKLAKKEKWPQEKIEILRDAYSKQLPLATIAEKLGPGYSRQTICGKAGELGLTRCSSWDNSEEQLFEYFYSTGLSPKELMHHMSGLSDGQMRHRIGRERDRFCKLSYNQCNSFRREAAALVRDMVGDLSPDYPGNHGAYVAAWIAAVGPKTGRDLREIARVALMPIPYVEKLFAELDSAGIWPGMEMKMPDLEGEDYKNISEIATDCIAYFNGHESRWLNYALNS